MAKKGRPNIEDVTISKINGVLVFIHWKGSRLVRVIKEGVETYRVRKSNFKEDSLSSLR